MKEFGLDGWTRRPRFSPPDIFPLRQHSSFIFSPSSCQLTLTRSLARSLTHSLPHSLSHSPSLSAISTQHTWLMSVARPVKDLCLNNTLLMEWHEKCVTLVEQFRYSIIRSHIHSRSCMWMQSTTAQAHPEVALFSIALENITQYIFTSCFPNNSLSSPSLSVQ